MRRARRILRALGSDADRPTPAGIEGRTACVTVRRFAFASPGDEAETIVRNEVPYDGWSPIGGAR